jgi:hypothetical protein
MFCVLAFVYGSIVRVLISEAGSTRGTNLIWSTGQVRTETKVGKSLVGLGLGTLGLESCPCINPVDGRKYGVFRNQLAAARHVDNIEIS